MFAGSSERRRPGLDEYDFFYCDRCKTVQPLKEKPAILERTSEEREGEYLCEGWFACGWCGFQRAICCEVCQEVQRLELEEFHVKRFGNDIIAGRVICGRCQYIITTLYPSELAAE